MISGRAALVVIAMSVPWLVSCERSRAEGGPEITKIRMSTGLRTGTFGPFSEALAKGYSKLAPDLSIELVDTTGNAVTSELLLSPYAARAPRTIGVVVGQTADALLTRRIDAAFTISGIPHDDVGRATRGGARLVHVNGAAIDAGLVRRLTAALFEMLPRLSAQLDFLHDMDPEHAPATPVPLHQGATLYYRERELRR